MTLCHGTQEGALDTRAVCTEDKNKTRRIRHSPLELGFSFKMPKMSKRDRAAMPSRQDGAAAARRRDELRALTVAPIFFKISPTVFAEPGAMVAAGYGLTSTAKLIGAAFQCY